MRKKRTEAAYRTGEAMGLAVWCTDQAGPYRTIPYPGHSWRPRGDPASQPHESLREGTAKALTLFRPADGRARVEGVTACPNAVLHPRLNTAEGLQRILKRRARDGQHPRDTARIIARLEAVARHRNEAPTPFVWGGSRADRRRRQRERRHRVGGSGAWTRTPVRRVSEQTYGHGQAT